MRRIYYLLSNIDEVEELSNTLHENGIADWQFHVLSRDREGLLEHHIHQATLFQERDIVHSGERGALIGGAFGCYLALFTAPWAIASTELLFAIVVLLVSAGVAIGAAIGHSHENYKTARFHRDLEEGKYLVLLDVKKDQYALVLNLLHHEFPALEIQGKDTTFVNPFKSGAWIHA